MYSFFSMLWSVLSGFESGTVQRECTKCGKVTTHNFKRLINTAPKSQRPRRFICQTCGERSSDLPPERWGGPRKRVAKRRRRKGADE